MKKVGGHETADFWIEFEKRLKDLPITAADEVKREALILTAMRLMPGSPPSWLDPVAHANSCYRLRFVAGAQFNDEDRKQWREQLRREAGALVARGYRPSSLGPGWQEFFPSGDKS